MPQDALGKAFGMGFADHKRGNIGSDAKDCLQIIGAGLPRCGTTSLKAALEILGFDPCHHMVVMLPLFPGSPMNESMLPRSHRHSILSNKSMEAIKHWPSDAETRNDRTGDSPTKPEADYMPGMPRLASSSPYLQQLDPIPTTRSHLTHRRQRSPQHTSYGPAWLPSHGGCTNHQPLPRAYGPLSLGQSHPQRARLRRRMVDLGARYSRPDGEIATTHSRLSGLIHENGIGAGNYDCWHVV